MEVQRHGFTWQRDISINVYGAIEDELNTIGYTAKDDLPANLNRLDNVIVSIKTTKRDNTIDLGDFLRFYDTIVSGEKIHMTVIFYIQNGDYKSVKKIIEVNLTNCSKLLFGDINRSDIEELDKIVKDIPHGPRTIQEKENTKLVNKKIKDKCPCIIPNVKADSKNQRRLQCSFNKFQDFIRNNARLVISESDNNQFRGGSIQSQILSGPRTFNN
jgi:hypothetical protein